MEYLNKSYFGNSIYEYIIAVAVTLAFSVAGYLLVRISSAGWKKLHKGDAFDSDFLITDIKSKFMPIIYFGALYLGIKSLTLSPEIMKTIKVATLIIFTILGARFSIAFISDLLEIQIMKNDQNSARKKAFKGILSVFIVLIWTAAVILLLDNLGFKISTLVAGMGIGGIAIALAAQTLLGDMFSYFSIFFDKPFEIGDFIVVNEHLGVIEAIGIKTTRIRSLGGEQLIFSNTDLTNSRIKNYKRMERRRVVFKLGFIYQTELEKLKEIPKTIKEIIESIQDTVFDRAHFSSYGDFNLVFEIVYYVIGNDYNKYMDIQQEINLRIMEYCRENGIEFAFPTQTVYLERENSV